MSPRNHMAPPTCIFLTQGVTYRTAWTSSVDQTNHYRFKTDIMTASSCMCATWYAKCGLSTSWNDQLNKVCQTSLIWGQGLADILPVHRCEDNQLKSLQGKKLLFHIELLTATYYWSAQGKGSNASASELPLTIEPQKNSHSWQLPNMEGSTVVSIIPTRSTEKKLLF